MKDILLKRNTLKNNSIHMRTIKFEPNIKKDQVAKINEDQEKIYKHWKFYDKFIKAREEVKNEIKPNNVGKEE